jgi:ATP-dependent DNA helicase PIF1
VSLETGILSEEQKQALDIIKKGGNIFITGGAGTGKSFLLNYLKQEFDKKLHVTASTGIAAVNVGGTTLHSWASLGIGKSDPSSIANRIKRNFAVSQRVRFAQMVAIDEVSMISAELLDKLDQVLKIVRQNNYPFGGIQLVLFGDFLQLPPVFKGNTSEGFFEELNEYSFESRSWAEAQVNSVALKYMHRQKDSTFINLLNNLRVGKLNSGDIDILNSRTKAKIDIDLKPTILTTHNFQADIVNKTELEKIKARTLVFKARQEGEEGFLSFLKKSIMVPLELRLKAGAQVIMLKNTYQDLGIINGSRGEIVSFESDSSFPVVKFLNGQTITVSPEEWRYEELDNYGRNQTKALIKQIPLRLAYAITVHKSQGMTLEAIECDLGRSFSEGQVYVALSRSKTIEGVFLKSFDHGLVKVNQKALSFYEHRSLI